MSSRSSERCWRLSRVFCICSLVSTAPDSEVQLAQLSSAVGASSSHGAPPLRPSVPHDISPVSSVPHDGSVTSMVRSVGGGFGF